RVRVEGSRAHKWRSRAPIEGSRVHKWWSRGLMGKPGASQARKGDPTSQQGEYSDVVYPCPRERGARASVFDGRANRGAHLGVLWSRSLTQGVPSRGSTEMPSH